MQGSLGPNRGFRLMGGTNQSHPMMDSYSMSDEYTLKVGDLDILTEHDEALLFVMFAGVMKLGFMVPGDVYSMVRDMGRAVPPIKICPTRPKTQGT